MTKPEDVKVLMNFGLSLVQATIYLNLVKLGKADVKSIAQLTKIASQDVYQAMPALEERKLVKKITCRPTLYTATSVEKAFQFLLKCKKMELDKLDSEKQLLIDTLSSNQTVDAGETAEFTIASEVTMFFETHQKMLEETRSSIDMIIGFGVWGGSVPAIIYDEWASLKKLLENSDLKIRLITNKSADTRGLVWQPLMSNPSFQVKYAVKPIAFGMHIFDDKQITLQINKEKFLPSLFSNNPNIVKFATIYFKSLWEKSNDE